jgi:signal transduction histidine kinase/CheY-like chemotaxis protein
LKAWVAVIAAFFLVLLWAIIYAWVDHGYTKEMRESELSTTLRARVFAENSKSTIKRVNEILLNTRRQWSGDQKLFSKVIQQEQKNFDDIIFQVAVIDRDGLLLYSSLTQSTARTDLSQREHFKVHKESPDQDRLFISKPLIGRVSKQWSIQFTRPLFKANKFNGVLVVSISPTTFTEFAKTLADQPNSAASIIRNTGEIMARYPSNDAYIGKSIAPIRPTGDAISGSRRITTIQTDGLDRVVGYYKLTDYGLVFTIAESVVEILRPVKQRLIFGIVAGAITSLIVLLLLYKLLGALIEAELLRIALAKEKLHAENANAAKTQFLTQMSHEVRTPLNGILGMASLLLDKNLHPEQTDFVRNITDSGESLLTIINEILDLSQVEAGSMRFATDTFCIRTQVDLVLSTVRISAEKKGLVLQIQIPADLNQFYVGDSSRIGQVLINLVGNAIKFTASGAVVLKIIEMQEGLRFEVQDSGVGIAAEVQHKLFTRFSQLEAPTTGEYRGSGLGLSICKRFVEGMGGTIGVASTPGKGSCFWFELPLPKADNNEHKGLSIKPLTSVNEPPDPNHSKLKILLAEDHPINQKLMLILLDQMGYAVDLAEDGEQALKKANKTAYSLILMDIQMPVMDGLAATRRIRSSAGLNTKTPIIALTANAMQLDRAACLDAGMTDFMTKPFKKEVLAACLTRHLYG